MQFSFRSYGSTKNIEHFLASMSRLNGRSLLEKYAQAGVAALASATPVDSGVAANSWGYRIESGRGYTSIVWTNNDIENGFPVVIALQYGHGTGTGGYVQGQDFINPAIQPVMDHIADEVWRVVRSA